MAEVLDYSSGRPAGAAVRRAGYVGVVRYIGTPGRGKNLTRAEAQDMLANDVPIALVYEGGAGWMLGGSSAGAAAARACVDDARTCGVEIRGVFFAADFDVTNSGQMAAVQMCLSGAASVLSRELTGVYGEADVIDACLSAGSATRGWQTKAWSGGRVSARACLLQQIGAVTVGGIECDRNTVLKPDWGQAPYEGDDMPTPQEIAQELATNLQYRLAMRGELITALSDPGHQYLQDDISKANRPLADQLANLNTADGSLLAKVDALSAAVQTQQAPAVDPAAVAAALDYDKLAAAIAAHIQLKAI